MFEFRNLTSICTIVLTMLAATPSKAQFELTKPDGRVVVLHDDFTWKYRSDSGPFLQDNWNPAACSFTGSAAVKIPASGAQIDRIVTWYRWDPDQQSASAGFYSPNGSTVISGQIARGTCDLYQPQWCEGLLDVGRALAGGTYTLQVMPPRICQNAGSDHAGFIRVVGRAGTGGVSTPPATGSSPPPPQPPAQTAVGDYVGCFAENDNAQTDGLGGRVLGGAMIPSNSAMTNQKCTQFCGSKGFAYAGTQYASQCFCGNSYADRGSSTNCTMNCSGDSTQKCGGGWANSVYRTRVSTGTGAPASTTTSIAGTWDTSEGVWTASADGSGTISGPYQQDGGHIVGRMNGQQMTGHWREDNSALRCKTARNGEYHWGNFRFTFSPDMTSFTGAYGHCDETPDHPWKGARK